MTSHHQAISIAAAIGFVVSLTVFIVTFQHYSEEYQRFQRTTCPVSTVKYPVAVASPVGWWRCSPQNQWAACVRVYSDAVAPGLMVDKTFPERRSCTFVGDCGAPRKTQLAWASKTARGVASTVECFYDKHPVTAIYLNKPRFNQRGAIVTMYVLMFIFAIVIFFMCVAGGYSAAHKRAPYIAAAREDSPVNEPLT